MTSPGARLDDSACSVDALATIVEAADGPEVRLAERAEQGVPVYAAAAMTHSYDDLLDEWADVLAKGAGIFVVEDAVEPDAVDAATAVFYGLIEEQRRAGAAAGDHFAAPGANDRIWNALEKLCLRAPDVFAGYYASPAIAAASLSWLGPAYQITSQVNVVNPGGAAQEPHRDYHLGFMTTEQAAAYPRHVQLLSPALTLQGAVAHTDMPVDTGPTMYLPHSQKYDLGYLAWRDPAVKSYFDANRAQLPLGKGDAVFFNPALFHAAGNNRTTSARRMANLLQVSSAFGRAMESVDRRAMVRALYPCLGDIARHDAEAADRVIAAAAEGYAFPADLDVAQPVDGLAPASDADLVRTALREGWPAHQLAALLS